MVKKKRLFYDLEVSPNIGFFWQPGHKISIGYENIIQERAIICACYKWEGEKKVHFLTWDRKKSDQKLVKELVKVFDSATEVVGHNSDAFDTKWLRTRAIKWGARIAPNCVSLDTLKAARGKFKFNSNRLDYVASYLGVGRKIKTDFGLWKDIVLKNCPVAMAKMVRYCKEDVRILEGVFEKMNPYLPAKTHYGEDKRDCPECGGLTKISKTRKTAAGVTVIQRQCHKCGKYHTTNK